jgi:hypothetical protein
MEVPGMRRIVRATSSFAVSVESALVHVEALGESWSRRWCAEKSFRSSKACWVVRRRC